MFDIFVFACEAKLHICVFFFNLSVEKKKQKMTDAQIILRTKIIPTNQLPFLDTDKNFNTGVELRKINYLVYKNPNSN